MFAIAERHESPNTVRASELWWRHGRELFDVARDDNGKVLGFAIMAASSAIPRAVAEADELVRAWLMDLESGPGRERGALFHRRALSADHGGIRAIRVARCGSRQSARTSRGPVSGRCTPRSICRRRCRSSGNTASATQASA